MSSFLLLEPEVTRRRFIVTDSFALPGHMNATTYDESTKVASIQPGSDWKRVFDTLDPYGVVSVGGRASVVGVGGFTTGGGVSSPSFISPISLRSS